MLLSEFLQAEKLIPCPRKIICTNSEQNSLLGDILNAGDNVYDQENYGFTGSFFKISPIVTDDYTKKIDEYATRTFETTEKYRE